MVTFVRHCLSDAFDTELMLSCMEKLKNGQAVSIPNYDMKTHRATEPARQVLICILEMNMLAMRYLEDIQAHWMIIS